MCYTLEWQTRGGAVLERSAIELAAGVAEARPYSSHISHACFGEDLEAIKHLAGLEIEPLKCTEPSNLGIPLNVVNAIGNAGSTANAD